MELKSEQNYYKLKFHNNKKIKTRIKNLFLMNLIKNLPKMIGLKEASNGA